MEYAWDVGYFHRSRFIYNRNTIAYILNDMNISVQMRIMHALNLYGHGKVSQSKNAYLFQGVTCTYSRKKLWTIFNNVIYLGF